MASNLFVSHTKSVYRPEIRWGVDEKYENYANLGWVQYLSFIQYPVLMTIRQLSKIYMSPKDLGVRGNS